MSQREHIAENALMMIAGGHYRGDVADYAQQVLNEINAAPDQPTAARLNVCPGCGGEADNGHDRCYPPNPYYCTKCATNPTPALQPSGAT